MLLNPQFAKNIPHEYLATSKFKSLENFNETALLDKMPSLSIIKITDYLEKITESFKQSVYCCNCYLCNNYSHWFNCYIKCNYSSG